MKCLRGTALGAAIVVAASVFLGSEIARADPEDEAAAETLFADARALMHDGKVAEACRKFSESYRLDHAAGALLNLALCHEKEGKIASAWAEYKQSVTLARRAGRVEREEVATEAAAALEPRLPRLTVSVPPNARVNGLEVVRNQTTIEQGGWGTPLPVDPGEVSIEVRAPARKPWSMTLVIQPGESRAVSVPLLEIDETALAKAPWWTPRRRIGAAVGAAGVVVAGVGAAFGVLAIQKKQEALESCPTFDGQVRCTASGSSQSQAALQEAWVSDITIGVGVVAVAAAAYLIVTDKPKPLLPPDASPPAPATAKIDLMWVGQAGAGVRLTW